MNEKVRERGKMKRRKEKKGGRGKIRKEKRIEVESERGG